MKNRNLILGLCASLAATVSAVASALVAPPTPAYVRIKTTTNMNPHCVLTNAYCNSDFPISCKVTVQGFMGLGRNLTGVNVCPQMTGENDHPIGTTLTTSEVIIEN